MTALLEIEDLKTHFPIRSAIMKRTVATVRAVDGVSLTVAPGETVGLAGESGCGKSTLARTILRLERPTAGAIRFEGEDVAALGRRRLGWYRRNVQVVFQNPYASLDPRMTVDEILTEPLRTHRAEGDHRRRVAELLDQVGLSTAHARRYPHEFSGGQRQRIAIARAIALRPRLVICDEAVSALDVSVQAQILNLLADLKEELGMAYLFISHDLGVLRHIADRVGVMYLGKLVELGPAESVYSAPAHPYTNALLSAVPVTDPDAERSRERIRLTGSPPSPVDPPPGCRFAPRCARAQEDCRIEHPALRAAPSGRAEAACLHPVADPRELPLPAARTSRERTSP